MIRDVLLATGVVMSYASQLSIPGFPLGFGEFFLLLWIMLSIARILAGGRLAMTEAVSRLSIFWVVLTLTLCVGTILGYFTTLIHKEFMLHDAIAYVLLACITLLATTDPDARIHFRRTAWFIVLIANLGLAVQVGLAWGWLHQGGVDPWYWNRFRGWSENPNQLALYCAAFGPLALHLATTTRKTSGRIVGFLGLILPFYVGRLTQSDTYLYTSILTVLIFVGLRLRTWFVASRFGSRPGRQIAILLIVGAIPLAVAMGPATIGEVAALENFVKSMTKDKGGEASVETASLRLTLWEDAVNTGVRAASLGLGPGPHLERPAVFNQQFLPRPFEAHSTVLDLYTQGGLIAVLALVWLAGSAAAFAWRAQLDALLTLLVSLGIFSMPHLIIRHPIVWFSLALCLAVGKARAPARHAIGRPIGRGLATCAE